MGIESGISKPRLPAGTASGGNRTHNLPLRRRLPYPVRPRTLFGSGRPRGVIDWSFRVDAGLFWEACRFRWWRLNKGHWGRRLPGADAANILLHNWVMERLYGVAPHGELTTDHIDGNPSNNCLANLRPATATLQCLNRSGVAGVTLDRTRWKARLCGKSVGFYATEAEARAAYLGAKEKAMATEIRNSWLIYRKQLEDARNG